MSTPLRLELVRTARQMGVRGLVEGTEGNVSARDGDLILITPAGFNYLAMRPDDVAVLGVPGEHPPSSEWRVHAAVYAARPDVGAIVHTHSPMAIAWSRRDEPLDDGVPTSRFAETGTKELAVNVVHTLGDRDAVLMAGHGVVGVGATLRDALRVCERVEELARERSR